MFAAITDSSGLDTMYEQLTAEDGETRRAAARDLYRMADQDSESASEYALLLVDLIEDNEAGHYATATLQRVVSDEVLDVDAYVETLRTAVVDDRQSVLNPFNWLRNRPSESASDTELRRIADLLGWLAKEQPVALADEAETLLAALEHQPTRSGAMEALFHISSRHSSLDVSAESIVEYFDDDDPTVRGDAIGIVGQIECSVVRDDVIPYFSELMRTVEDPAVTVQQTALGVLIRGSEYWTHDLSADQLYDTLTVIVSVITTESDPTVRSRAESFYGNLAHAAVNGVVRSMLGSGSTSNQTVEDTLVASGVEQPELAYEIATSVAYHASSSDGGDTRRDEILNRLAEQYPERFDSGKELLETARNNKRGVSTDHADLVLNIVSAQATQNED